VADDATDVCPRCGGGFHCGAGDTEPCACCRLQLNPVLLAELRVRYAGCLCLACLSALALEGGRKQSEPRS
jgi:hypothetical protein